MEERLRATLIEIERIEGELRANGDVARLKSFGDPERGTELAQAVGHPGRLRRQDARRIDQLSVMPDAFQLIRDYLQSLFGEDQVAPSSWSRGAVSSGS
jgi:hypothetical protein